MTRRLLVLGLPIAFVLVWGLLAVGSFLRVAARLETAAGPELLAEASRRSGRRIEAGRVVRPSAGKLRIEALKVYRGLEVGSPVHLAADAVELDYPARLGSWRTWWRALRTGRWPDVRHGKVSVRGVTIHTEQGAAVLSADRGSAGIDLARWISGRDLAYIAPRVEVHSAALQLVRQPDGRWNVAGLLPSDPKRKPLPVRMEIRCADLGIAFTDHLPGAHTAPQRQSLRGQATVTLQGSGELAFALRGRIHGAEPSQGEDFRVVGTYFGTPRSWTAEVTGGSRRLPYWLRYLAPRLQAARLARGSGRFDGLLWQVAPDQPLQFRARGQVWDAGLTLPGLGAPLESARGSVTLDRGALNVDGTAVVAGAQVGAVGEVRLGQTAEARLKVRSRRFSLAAAKALFPRLSWPDDLEIPAEIAVEADLSHARGRWDVTGSADTAQARLAKLTAAGVRLTFAGYRDELGDLSLGGEVRAAEANSRGVTGRRVQGDYLWDGQVLYASLSASVFEGSAEGEIWIDSRASPARFHAVGSVKHALIERALVPTEKLRAYGAAETEFSAGGTFESIEATAFVAASPLSVNGLRVGAVEARVRLKGEAVEIEEATVRRGPLSATVRGHVSLAEHYPVDVQVWSNKLQLSAVLEQPEQAGTVQLEGRVTGTAESPSFQGIALAEGVSVPNGVDGVLVLDDVRTDVQATRTTVELRNVVARAAPLAATCPLIRLTRAANDDASPFEIAAEVEVEGLRLPYLLAEYWPAHQELPPLSGRVDSLRLRIGGTDREPTVRASLRAAGVAYDGWDLGIVSAEGDFDVPSRTFRLEYARQVSGTVRSEVNGTIRLPSRVEVGPAAPARLALTFDIRDFDLTPLLTNSSEKDPAPVTARGRLGWARGTVSGTAGSPDLQATVQLEGVQVNGRFLQIQQFTVRATNGVAMVHQLVAELAGGRVIVDHLVGSLHRDEMQFDRLRGWAGSLRLSDVPVSAVQQLLEDSPVYRSESFRAVRDVVDYWSSPLSGELSGSIELPLPVSPSLPLPDVLDALRAPPRSPRLQVDLLVPELRSPPDPAVLPFRARLTGSFDGSMLRLAQAELAQGTELLLNAQGTWTRGAARTPGMLELSYEARGLELEALARLPVRGLTSLLRPVLPVAGTLAVSGQATGSERAPVITGTLELARPRFLGIGFSRLGVRRFVIDRPADRVTLEGGVLARAHPGEATTDLLRVAGYMPLRRDGWALDIARPRDIQLSIPERSLALLSELAAEAETHPTAAGESGGRARLMAAVRRLAGAAGLVSADVRLAGTAAVPNDSGQIRVRNAALTLDGLDTQLRDVAIELELSGTTVQVNRLEGQGSQGGTVRGGGRVYLLPPPTPQPASGPMLDLWLAADSLRVVEKKLERVLGPAYAGTQFTGTLQTVDPGAPGQTAPLRIGGSLTLPEFHGGVRVDAATLNPVYTAEAVEAPEQSLLEAGLNLRFFTGQGFTIRNSMARIEVRGDVAVQGDWSSPQVNGRLSVVNGNIQLPGMRLRNVQGDIRIAYDARTQGLRLAVASPITVDLRAESNVRMARGFSQEMEAYDLDFRITGSPGGSGEAGIRSGSPGGGLSVGDNLGLSVTVVSDPPLPAREIEALIRQHYGVEGIRGGGSNVVETLRGQIEQALAANVSSALTGRLEDALRSAFGFGTVSIDFGVAEALRIRLARQLFGRLHGAVSHSLGGAQTINQTRYEVYYRFTPRLRIGYRQEEPLGLRVFYFSGGTSF